MAMADKPDAETPQPHAPTCKRCGCEMQEGLLADHGEADFVFKLCWHSVVRAVGPKPWSIAGLFNLGGKKDFEGPRGPHLSLRLVRIP
jgi:hypothetical protein